MKRRSLAGDEVNAWALFTAGIAGGNRLEEGAGRALSGSHVACDRASRSCVAIASMCWSAASAKSAV